MQACWTLRQLPGLYCPINACPGLIATRHESAFSWFIRVVVARFHPALKAHLAHCRIPSADPVLRAQRSPDSLKWFDDFLFDVYTFVRPGLGGSPDTILPAILLDLERHPGVSQHALPLGMNGNMFIPPCPFFGLVGSPLPMILIKQLHASLSASCAP
jgi:hypothetical protein